MGGLFGPFTAAAGTLQQCAVATDAEALYVQNTSRFDLALSLQLAQPVTTTSFGGRPWDVIVPAGDRAGVVIPMGNYGANGFPGYVWVLPVDNSGSLALSGTKSGNNQFYIQAVNNPALLPADYASAQFVNLASQPRDIVIPVEPAFFSQFNSSIPNPDISTNPATLLTLATGQTFSGTQFVTVYLYGVHAYLSNTAYGDLYLLVVERSGIGAFIAAHNLVTQGVAADIPATTFPPFAITTRFRPASTCTEIDVAFYIPNIYPDIGNSILTPTMRGWIAADIDLTGQVPPPGIGNGSATPPGAIY